MPRVNETKLVTDMLWKSYEVQGVIKYCVFSKNFHYFGTSPSPTLRCYWLFSQ